MPACRIRLTAFGEGSSLHAGALTGFSADALYAPTDDCISGRDSREIVNCPSIAAVEPRPSHARTGVLEERNGERCRSQQTVSCSLCVASARRARALARPRRSSSPLALSSPSAGASISAHGHSSLFAYCTRALLLSEHAAYARIEAARAARRFPVILPMLADGSLTLTAVCLLAPHLTDANHELVLSSARHKSKREVEHIVAERRPAPDVPSTVRKLPVPAAVELSSPNTTCLPRRPLSPPRSDSTPIAEPLPRPVVRPLAPQRYRIQFTVGRGTYDKLQHATALMRHRIPNGDVARLFDDALTLLIADVERSKCGLSVSPRRGRGGRPDTRHIPAAVRRAVWRRDAGQCAFVGSTGRCTERAFLDTTTFARSPMVV